MVLPHTNKQSRSQGNMKLFRSSVYLPHKNKDTPVVRNNEKMQNFIVLLLSQLYCLKVSRGFRFLKQKTAAHLLLYKRNQLFDKYKLSSTIFYLNNKK